MSFSSASESQVNIKKDVSSKLVAMTACRWTRPQWVREYVEKHSKSM